MNKAAYIVLLLLTPLLGFGQARVMLNGAYVVLNGGTFATPIYLEVNNPATNAITRSTGWITSESEFNMVKWDIGTNTGTYTLPFGYQTLNYIPLSVNIITAGTPAAGTIKFSTYHTLADNWTCCPPSDVTNMDPVYTALSQPSATDDSWWVVDRFWIIDAQNYATKPSPNLKFTYMNSGGGTEIAAPNVLTEPNLIAQRFNSTLGTWGDYFGTAGTDVSTPPVGTCMNNTATAVTPANFFRSWTLSDLTDPLPITLTAFTTSCVANQAVIKWTTQTETNNRYFTVQRSANGIHYQAIGTVAGAGNSSTPHNYSFTDNSPLSGTSYYRLTQTDFDGKTMNLPPATFNGCSLNGTTINAFYSNIGRNIVVSLNAAEPDAYSLVLTDVLGQVLVSQTKSLPAGYTRFFIYPHTLSNGIYILSIRSNSSTYNRKLQISNY